MTTSTSLAPCPPPQGGGPAPRRLRLPSWEPPYDTPDTWERSGLGRPAAQRALALAFVFPSGTPAAPAPPRELWLVPARTADDEADEIDFGPQRTASARLPAPHGWAARFVQAVVEVLGGERPTSQLVRWTSSGVYDDLTGLVRSPEGRTTRAVVRSVHVTEPVDGVAEVAAMVRRGARCTAVALRLEGLDGRWQCTALELG